MLSVLSLTGFCVSRSPAIFNICLPLCQLPSHPASHSVLRSQALQFVRHHLALLQVDEYLFRSWFSLVSLESLASYLENCREYLSYAPARVLDCFQGISYRLRGLGKIPDQNIQVCCGVWTSK